VLSTHALLLTVAGQLLTTPDPLLAAPVQAVPILALLLVSVVLVVAAAVVEGAVCGFGCAALQTGLPAPVFWDSTSGLEHQPWMWELCMVV
jgi:hypothetical protein